MLEGLLRVACLRDLDDQNDGRFLVTVRPWFPDIFSRHGVVVPELRARAPLDDPPANLYFRVGINKVHLGNGNAGVAQCVFAFQ